MSNIPHLVADAVIGNRTGDCLILAAHPDERMLPNGWEPSPSRRTFVLHHDGVMARTRLVLPDPLVRAWTSGQGVGYAAPVKGNYIYVYAQGKWKREPFSETEERILGLWGLTGSGGETDTVYLSSASGLFIRSDKQWRLHTLPEPARKVHGVHGLTPDAIHVCSDQGLYLWNGQTFELIENPPGSHPKFVWTRPDEVVAAGDNLTHWTEAGGWEVLDESIQDVKALGFVQDTLLVGTYEDGIHERGPDGVLQRVTAPMKCMAIQVMDDGAFARDKQVGFMRVAGQWRPLNMPLCQAGQMPLDAA